MHSHTDEPYEENTKMNEMKEAQPFKIRRLQTPCRRNKTGALVKTEPGSTEAGYARNQHGDLVKV